MNALQNTGVYYTQKEDLPIDQRVFFKKAIGENATMDNFREATPEELQEWKKFKEAVAAGEWQFK